MIEEHKKEFYSKNDENDFKKYLKRILQRFFEIEGINSQLSKEAMIVEAIRMYKEYCATKCKDWTIAVNGMTGLVYLSAMVLGGESKFDKNTAFNKDFGTIADTICEGNDPRLSDARTPKAHQHQIQDVDGLEEALQSIGKFKGSSTHTHSNIDVLNKIKYTGSRAKIDLKYLKVFCTVVRNLIQQLLNKKDEVDLLCEQKRNELDVILRPITPRIEKTEEEVDDIIKTWVTASEKYAKDKTIEWYWENKFKLHNVFFLLKDFEPLKKNLDEGIKRICEGEIPIEPGSRAEFVEEIVGWRDGPFILEGESLKDIYNSSTPLEGGTWHWDESISSFVEEVNWESSYPRYLSTTKFGEYTHRVTFKSEGTDNDVISTVIAYMDDGSDLSLIITTGGITSPATGCSANLVKNFPGSYNVSDGIVIDSVKISESLTDWNAVSNGISVLVKRTLSEVKIWVKYDDPDIWEPVGDEINPTDPPLITYSLAGTGFDARGKYGYGTFSQPNTFYQNVWMRAVDYDTMPIYDNVLHGEMKKQIVEIPEPAKSKMVAIDGRLIDKYVVTYFRWEDSDGNTHTQRMPYKYMYTEHTELGVSCAWNAENKFIINYCVTTHFPKRDYTCADFYVVSEPEIHAYEVRDVIESYSSRIYKIENPIRENAEAMTEFLKPGKFYFVDGVADWNNDIYDWDGNLYNDIRSLVYIVEDEMSRNIAFNQVSITQGDEGDYLDLKMLDETAGWIAVYDPPSLTDVFNNPRIYFQVYDAPGHPEESSGIMITGTIYDGVTGDPITT